MTRIKLDEDLKKAISELSSKQKDKLIFRLLPANKNLANQLYFEMVDHRGVEERRAAMEEKVITAVEKMTAEFHSPGYLKMDMGFLSAEITEHVRTTKDKLGEVSLNLLMLQEVLRLNKQNILGFSFSRSRKCCVYIIARTFKILLLLQKQHEDIFIEFTESLENLGQLMGLNDFVMRTAILNGLDVNWLMRGEIPDNLREIYTDLRSRGYLK